MPTPTYTPLANITVSSGAASVTFSSISQAYRDLVLVISGKATGPQNLRIYINSDTTAENYSWVSMQGNGSTTTSTTGYNTIDNSSFFDDTTVSVKTLNFMDYSATDKHKTFLNRGNNAGRATEAFAHRWANTSAITNIQIFFPSSSFAVGSSLALYGIAA